VQKGFTLDYLLNLSNMEKLFLTSSMELAFDEKVEEYKAKSLTFGG
jgi:hypothetical protein